MSMLWDLSIPHLRAASGKPGRATGNSTRLPAAASMKPRFAVWTAPLSPHHPAGSSLPPAIEITGVHILAAANISCRPVQEVR